MQANPYKEKRKTSTVVIAGNKQQSGIVLVAPVVLRLSAYLCGRFCYYYYYYY